MIYHQSLRPLFDMLGVCRLPWIELGLNEQHYARFYSAITGQEATLPELLQQSDDIYDLTPADQLPAWGCRARTTPCRTRCTPVRSARAPRPAR